MSNTDLKSALLYLVATPIGNLSDITHRAVEVLSSVSLIAAEDTRRTRILLDRLGISCKMMACHDHNESDQIPQILKQLEKGNSVALVSDAGTPLISDPGYHLVRAAQEADIRVVPIPGPCSPIVALSASGLPTDRFIFEGFLPAKPAARKKLLQTLAEEERTLIFLESSHRIVSALEDCQSVLKEERETVIARELTKTYETIRRGSLAEIVNWVKSDSNQQKGEFVVLITGSTPDKNQLRQKDMELVETLLKDLPLSRAADLASRITGHKRNLCYQYALKVQGDKRG